MSFYCPVCNGMKSLQFPCPRCHKDAQDCGRYGDFMGPYSPYRPIDDLKLTNGFNDLKNHQCIHVVYCVLCDQTYPVEINERL